MRLPPPKFTRTDTLFPSTTRFRSCEHLHLAGVESTLVRGKRRPCGNALGSRGQLCIGRYDAKLLLSCENTAAGLIPAHVETAAIACDPLRCRLMRLMDGRSEERRVGKGCAVRVDLGCRRIIKKKHNKNTYIAYKRYTDTHKFNEKT